MTSPNDLGPTPEPDDGALMPDDPTEIPDQTPTYRDPDEEN